MGDWLRRYGGHALIFSGLLLFSTLLRSASGPADALAGAAIPTPPETSEGAWTGPLLIPSSRRAAVAEAPSQDQTVPAVALQPVTPTAGPAEPATAAPLAAEPPAPPLPPTDRLVIPRIKLDARVVDVGVLPSGEMETAAFAAGRLSYGAQAGDAGNVVIAGHNDIQGEVFRRLAELQVGDDFSVYRGPQAFTYRVEARAIVREDGATEVQRRENARWMEPTDESVATLISCYPYRVDTHRIILRARLLTHAA